MTLHSAGAGPGCQPRSTSLKSFRRPFVMFRREAAYTPFNCTHCISIIMRRLSLGCMAFLPCLLAYLFLEQIPQTCTRFAQLRLRITHRASHDLRNLVVFVPLDPVHPNLCPSAPPHRLDQRLT